MDSAYDNVEFPIRRPPGTVGTWPGHNATNPIKPPTPKISKAKQEYKLSPVLENDDGIEIFEDEFAEQAEIEDQRQKVSVMQTTPKKV